MLAGLVVGGGATGENELGARHFSSTSGEHNPATLGKQCFSSMEGPKMVEKL